MFMKSFPFQTACCKDQKSREELRATLNTGLFPVEVEIVERLAPLCAHYRYKRYKRYTKAVKEELRALGRSKGYLVYPEKVGESGELKYQWLFDLVWLEAKCEKDDFDWKTMRGVRLACESEWNDSDDSILWDFLKLTIAVADVRLFVYGMPKAKSKFDRTHPADLCKRVCPLSRGFRYLLIGFPYQAGEAFRVDAWTA
jgi:hypothetical protein